ncbi:hypothetical protein [Streptomyces lateritius]|uniref:hypothetical protein n=1 Tax=Streptomyces lateritius TaxID=67313 RepID=UPI001674837F|nr:hypothetical protein [Streptomyces lateritius]GGU11277.1 hypothetical protein GCM10010272_65520 [Streptomyces lateritius]
MRHHPFPDDLVTAQRSWAATYEELARTGTARTTALRRRLLRLSGRVYFHPYWDQPRPTAGRPELAELARAEDEQAGSAA